MNKKILIIDDAEQDRKGIAVALQREGYTALSFAQNAQEGIEAAQDLAPELIIIDVVLPDMDGFDVCRQFKDAFADSVKIIMITGHLDAVNVQKARGSGANEIIEKIPGFRNINETILSICD